MAPSEPVQVRVLASSVRNRLFSVVAAMALLASGAIAIAFVATEPERLDVQEDARAASDLYALTSELSAAIRDQELAVEDALLSRSPAAGERYRRSIEIELRVAERIRLEAAELPGVLTAVDALADAAAAWRSDFAEPAMLAVAQGSEQEVARIARASDADHEPSQAAIENLIGALGVAESAIRERANAVAWKRLQASGASIALMLAAAVGSLVLVRRWVTNPLGRLLATAAELEAGARVAFQAERDDEIGRLGAALERMRLALQGDADRSAIMNRFTEVTAFARDDAAIARSNLEALAMLIGPDAAVTHVLNRSKDRAIPEATTGSAAAEVLALHALSRCPGVVRGSIYVNADATEPLTVRCPVYPVEHGTLACIPLAHGELVGAIHLAWDRPDAFPLELRSSVARVAQHAALTIGNRRLLAALQGMASTDARTGLANSRSFDQALEDALSARREDESLAVLMVDIDLFKDLNDRYGHPAGDEALRAFADILRGCLRDGDVAARYGGEEFAIMLPTVDEATALAVAERIRSRTESTVVSLAPGITDRMTVSIGVATAPNQARERVTLLRLADDALYRAKRAGRNRVEYLDAASNDDRLHAAPGVPAGDGARTAMSRAVRRKA